MLSTNISFSEVMDLEANAHLAALPTDILYFLSREKLSFYNKNHYFTSEFKVGLISGEIAKFHHYQIKNIDNKIVYILATPKWQDLPPEAKDLSQFVSIIKPPTSEIRDNKVFDTLFIVCRRNDKGSNNIENFNSLIFECPSGYSKVSKDVKSQPQLDPIFFPLVLLVIVICYLILRLRKRSS